MLFSRLHFEESRTKLVWHCLSLRPGQLYVGKTDRTLRGTITLLALLSTPSTIFAVADYIIETFFHNNFYLMMYCRIGTIANIVRLKISYNGKVHTISHYPTGCCGYCPRLFQKSITAQLVSGLC